MRIATYNIEWFANLFNEDNALQLDDKWSSRYKVTRAQQIEAIAKVLLALNADALMVIEAPNTGHRQSSKIALEGFAATFGLRTRRALMGFASETQQEITLLYDPDKLEAQHDPIGAAENGDDTVEAPRFDGALRIDLDVDNVAETIRFSKPPLEVLLTPKGGTPFRLIGVHVKSKSPHGARSPAETLRLAIENRRKQLAQCIWLRRRVDYHLDRGEPVIVLGDFNDGPGIDEYEKLFGHSGVEVVLGRDRPAERRLYDPSAEVVLSPRPHARSTTSRFYLPDQKRFLNALLDYIMISPDLRDRAEGWRIWHPFDDPKCYNNPELRAALLDASDHFPVSLDLRIRGLENSTETA